MASGLARTWLPAACLVSLALSACGAPQGQDEMSWARAALERNDRVEIVAADAQSRSFTVRLKDTGELRMVRADQVIGAPGMPPAASAPASAAAAPEPAAQPAPAGAMAGSAAAPALAEAAAPASADLNAQSAPETASPPPAPKVFASRALQAASPMPPSPGQVLEAGPGYSIEAGSGGQAGAAAGAREPGASVAVELRHEPIVCQGARLLHIDNLNLQFDGDAVSAEDGCEIHITNSRIRATGVGVSARAANVHIDNSLIEGEAASIDASHGAQIYTASSRFRGLSRQLDTAAVHDLGGNVWN
jgi:hypothetical protein